MERRNLLAIGVLVLSALVALSVYMYEQRDDPGVVDADAGSSLSAYPDGVPDAAATALPVIHHVSPPVVSNGTDYPVLVTGENFVEGMTIEVFDEGSFVQLPSQVIDDTRATAVVSAGLTVPASKATGLVRIRVLAPDKTPGGEVGSIVVVNDAAYPRPWDFVTTDDGKALVVSPTDDLLTIVSETETKTHKTVDGAIAIETFVKDGAPHVAILGRYSGTIEIRKQDDPGRALSTIEVGRGGRHMLVQDGVAYVSNPVTDEVSAWNLATSERVGQWRVAGPHPGALAVAADWIAVGDHDTGDVVVVSTNEEANPRRVAPNTETQIFGGRTDELERYIMGGTAPRALVWSSQRNRLFVASAGPNLGPNDKGVQVGTNGGVSVVDPVEGKVERHVSMSGGIPEDLALDDDGNVLYAVDIALGRVVAFDVAKLTDLAAAKSALKWAVDVPAGPKAPRTIPAEELGKDGRATDSIHAGARRIRLSPDNKQLHVLAGISGEVVTFDVSGDGPPTVARTLRGIDLGRQSQRRAGEILFHSDVPRVDMTCDSCHYEGRGTGIVWTKTAPVHGIYRSPTLLGVGSNPPYYSPTIYQSLLASSGFIDHMRFRKVVASKIELAALTSYQAALVVPPNPWRSTPNGALPDKVTLPDGKTGNPRAGWDTFRESNCTSCHPAPTFTVDGVSDGRGKMHDLGTPMRIALRPDQQATKRYPVQVPSLSGIWDTFPLLHSGAAGLVVSGDQVTVSDPFALRALVANGPHGGMKELDEQKVNDLLAFLLML